MKENLRTPAGARKVIREIKRVTGRTTVTSFILDKSYATAQVPSKDEEVWNSFDYRNGTGDKRNSGGRMNGRATFDLAKVNWDALPRLIQATETELGLKKGKVTGVNVGLRDGRVELAIAASDAYGGAWLWADGNGKVLRRSKAS